MAKILENVDVVPWRECWDEWCDGKTRQIDTRLDTRYDAETFRVYFRQAAKRRGKAARTRPVSKYIVEVQAVPKQCATDGSTTDGKATGRSGI